MFCFGLWPITNVNQLCRIELGPGQAGGFLLLFFFKPREDEDAGRLMQEAKGFRKSMLVTQLREETVCGSIGEAA